MSADERLDMQLDQTFPASDPLPWIREVQTPKLYLDDLAVGRRFMSGSVVVSEREIKAFAAQFDPQPFHLDAQSAHGSLLGGLAASGWHTAAMTMRMLVDGDMKIAGGLIGVGGEISWPRPTRPGDILTVASEIIAVAPSRSKPDRGIVTVRNSTLNQHGEVVQLAEMKLLVPRDPSRL